LEDYFDESKALSKPWLIVISVKAIKSLCILAEVSKRGK